LFKNFIKGGGSIKDLLKKNFKKGGGGGFDEFLFF